MSFSLRCTFEKAALQHLKIPVSQWLDEHCLIRGAGRLVLSLAFSVACMYGTRHDPTVSPLGPQIE